jgi:hypothetical protein
MATERYYRVAGGPGHSFVIVEELVTDEGRRRQGETVEHGLTMRQAQQRCDELNANVE